jgi:hypothetical protein
LIIKPDPSRNEYVAWSTIVESPLCIGDADDIVVFLAQQYHSPESEARKRIARADATGTSSHDDEGAFGDFLIFEQRGTIDCAKLADLTRCLIADDLDGAYDLCKPFDDSAEVWRG